VQLPTPHGVGDLHPHPFQQRCAPKALDVRSRGVAPSQRIHRGVPQKRRGKNNTAGVFPWKTLSLGAACLDVCLHI
jgi:hypothetical protein